MSINEGNRCFYGGSGSAAFDIEFIFGVRFYLYRLNRTITRFVPLREKRVISMRFIFYRYGRYAPLPIALILYHSRTALANDFSPVFVCVLDI